MTAVLSDTDTTTGLALGPRLRYTAVFTSGEPVLTAEREGETTAQVKFDPDGNGPILSGTLALTRCHHQTMLRVLLDYPGSEYTGGWIAIRAGSMVHIHHLLPMAWPDPPEISERRLARELELGITHPSRVLAESPVALVLVKNELPGVSVPVSTVQLTASFPLPSAA